MKKLKNSLKIQIRKAEVSDAEKVIEYMKTVYGESENLTAAPHEFEVTIKQEEDFINNTNNSINSVMLIGLIDGEIVSIASLSGSQRKRMQHQVGFGISVLKKYWGLGVGTKMMEEVIKFANKNEVIEVIHLTVRADNVFAIKLYEKFGFEKVGHFEKYFKIDNDYFDSISMNLYLKK